jgi:hypothetical protein
MRRARGDSPPGRRPLRVHWGRRRQGEGIVEKLHSQRLLRLKHDHGDIGFVSAGIEVDESCESGWCLRVESPSDVSHFTEHLECGSPLALAMVTREGRRLRGEAVVAYVTGGIDSASVVTLAGMGPLLDG